MAFKFFFVRFIKEASLYLYHIFSNIIFREQITVDPERVQVEVIFRKSESVTQLGLYLHDISISVQLDTWAV